uniref:Sushi domain-containing protein n=1 Tax=Poecilia mexicana TaxID=48701 RepID=A0A3B3Y5F7_9TELE
MEVLLDTRRQRKLLILYLFIGTVAAECSKPEPGMNMILTDESLLKNDFPEGSEVTLQCSNGYENASGSGIMNCIDNKWTEPDLNCKSESCLTVLLHLMNTVSNMLYVVILSLYNTTLTSVLCPCVCFCFYIKEKDCGLPKAEPHMEFNISQGTLFGSVVKVTCEEGYQISGSSFKHCLPRGWFGKASCNIVTCSKPTEMENGEHSWKSDNKPEYQQTIHFTCKAGYTMLGNQTIQCTKTGKYDSEPPQCIETSTANGMTVTPTFHKATTVTARPSTNISTLKQGYRIRSSEETNTTPTTSKKEQNIETLNINKDKGHAAVIISVVVVTIVLCLVAFFLKKFLMRKKGSYDTGEDLKPELLQFQSL